MRLIILLLIGLVSFTTGCSTAQKPTTVGNLQIKVGQMEKRLAQRDQEIEELKREVRALSNQLEYLEAYRESVSEEETLSVERTDTAPSSSTKNETIVRVPVSVEEIQTALKNAGYYEGNIDGKIGRQSKTAIKEFQKDHDLVSDGVIGKKTWGELKNYLD